MSTTRTALLTPDPDDESDLTGRVRYDRAGAMVVVHNLVVTDSVVLGEARHWTTGVRGPAADEAELARADLTPFCQQALAIGALAIRGAGGTQEAHHLDRLIAEVGTRTAAASAAAADSTAVAATRAVDALEKATSGARLAMSEATQLTRNSFARAVADSGQQLSDAITRLVGGEDPVLASKLATLLAGFSADLDHRVSARTDELFTKAARQLDPRDPTSPLAAVTKQLGEQHAVLRGQLTADQKDIVDRLDRLSLALHTSAARAAITAVTPLKGAAYETAVHAELRSFAASSADEYLDKTRVPGRLPDCKAGDGVLVITAGSALCRVVVEMTNSDTVRRAWNDVLEVAERNRGANVSLGLVRTTEQLGDGQRLRVFGTRRFVLAHDPEHDDPGLLHAVLLVLRGQALANLGHTDAPNRALVHTKLSEAITCLQRLAEIEKSAGTIRKAADKIDAQCVSLHTMLSRLLAEADAALGDDQGPAAAEAA